MTDISEPFQISRPLKMPPYKSVGTTSTTKETGIAYQYIKGQKDYEKAPYEIAAFNSVLISYSYIN